ncbi:DUF397 domain-containing protein [Streptomyces sp. NPDC048290]|uniref:DUF397 domain-containing protein n=1 Tax=Streptomyces sp. NPDC048290 TaxID=3155811 RepID=UPI0034126A2B
MGPARWIKSSYSSPDGGNCLEVAPNAVAVLAALPVRDSKVAGGPVLLIAVPAWSAFVGHVRDLSV